jgi:hypothetical protein
LATIPVRYLVSTRHQRSAEVTDLQRSALARSIESIDDQRRRSDPAMAVESGSAHPYGARKAIRIRDPR